MHLMEDISPHSISSLMPGSLERDFDFFFFFWLPLLFVYTPRGPKQQEVNKYLFSLLLEHPHQWMKSLAK